MLTLLGCVAVGPTTEEALSQTPAAIAAFLRFQGRHGETPGGEGEISTAVVEHITEGEWLGNGSPYLTFGPDLLPVDPKELGVLLARFRSLQEELAGWCATQTPAQLDSTPAEPGRTARAVLLHTLGTPGAYLAAALGGAPGFSRVHGQAERGQLELPQAFSLVGEMATERAQATSDLERSQVRERSGTRRTLRKALRRMLEHDWEHLAELARRPGGPAL
ncbi:MAG: DinB family protein [Candidatus Dormibacteria bacterium]